MSFLLSVYISGYQQIQFFFFTDILCVIEFIATEEFYFADGLNYTQILFVPPNIMPFSMTLGSIMQLQFLALGRDLTAG